VAFLALYSRLEFASAPVLDGTWFGFLERTWVIAVLFALAVIELAIDKMPSLAPTRDQVLQPIKIVLGGVVFAAAMAPEHWISIVVCAVLGLAIAGLADHALRTIRPGPQADSSAAVFVSIYVDFIVLIGTLVFVLVPLIGALLALFLFLFVYRLRRRRRRKHKGLRILRG
jgi:uncharacterized membrane protein